MAESDDTVREEQSASESANEAAEPAQEPSTPSDDSSESIAEKVLAESEAARRVFASEADDGSVRGRRSTRKERTRRAEEAEETGEDEELETDADDDAPPAPNADDDEPVEGEADDDEEPEEDDASAPTLDPLLRHAAKRNGWTDDEIDQLNRANPELAEKTYRRLLQTTNELSARYGALGQQQAPGEANRTPQPPAGPPASGTRSPGRREQAPETSGDPLRAIYGEKADVLREKYDEEWLQDVLEPLLGPIQESVHMAQRQREEAVAAEIGQFYSGLPEDFSSLYGSGQNVSDEQIENRRQLAMIADQIYAGAQSQGVHLSVSEALERANMQFAAQHMAQLERKRLTRQVAKRSGQRTERPGKAGRRKAKTSDPSYIKAAEAYRERASELGLFD